jgi:hypothetical protein
MLGRLLKWMAYDGTSVVDRHLRFFGEDDDEIQ